MLKVKNHKSHISRNIEARRAIVGVTAAQMEEVSKIKRQQLYRIFKNPERTLYRTLHKLSLLLYCPLDILINDDISAVTNYPLPPANYLVTLEKNKEAYGFDSVEFCLDFNVFATDAARNSAN